MLCFCIFGIDYLVVVVYRSPCRRKRVSREHRLRKMKKDICEGLQKMWIFKNRILKSVTTLALLLALVAGMAASLGRKAEAAQTVIVQFNDINGILTQKGVVYGKPYGTLPTPRKKAGYTFVCWTCNGREITSSSIVSINGRHDISAKYRYEILPDSTIETFLKGCADPTGALNDDPKYTKGGGYIFQCTNNSTGKGMCTPCAIGNLLNRKLVYDTHTAAYRFDFEKDVIPVMYKIKASQGRLKNDNGIKYFFDVSTSYSEATGLEFTNASKGSGKFKKTYTLTKVDASGDKNAQLRKLLIQHPEGVVMHAGGHAVVVTGFTSDGNGNYTYFAIDTGSNLVNEKFEYTNCFNFNGNYDLRYSFLNKKLGKYSKGTDIVAKAGSFFYLN